MLTSIQPLLFKRFNLPARLRRRRSRSVGNGLVALLATHVATACVDEQATDSSDLETREESTGDSLLEVRENPLGLMGGHEPDDALRLRRERDEAKNRPTLPPQSAAPDPASYAAGPLPEQIRFRLITHDSSQNGSDLVAALPELNTIFAPVGIAFVFSPATDIEFVAATPVGASDKPNKACESSFPRANAVIGALPLIYCPEQGGGYSGADGSFALVGGLYAGHVAHELGHFFSLPHTFREYYRPFDRDLPGPPGADCGADLATPEGPVRWYSTECRVRQDVRGRWNDEKYDRCCIENSHGALICNQSCMNTIPSDILSWGASRLVYWSDGDGIADTGPAWHEHGSLPVACTGSVSLTFSFGSQSRTYTVAPGWTNPVSYYGCGQPLSFTSQQVARIRQNLFTAANRTHLLKKPLTLRESAMGDAAGFTNPAYYLTLRMADVNGDGRADLCARKNTGILCELSTGNAFTTSVVQPDFSDANGWAFPEYYQTIAFPDVNNDGRADVCGRGGPGVWCALSAGTSFGPATLWAGDFSNANGWSGAPYYSTLQFADVNADGRADLCGRGGPGVWCALSNGSTFGTPTLWLSNFSDGNGWGSGPQYYKTIRFPDLNRDGRADICGRGGAGVYCALSNGSSFAGLSLWQPDLSDTNGWNSGPQYYETLRYADVNGDNRLDLCARGSTGIRCGLSTGTSFAAPSVWTAGFRDSDGGNQPQYYTTINFPDINRDGRADFCGRGIAGVYCYRSNGSGFDLPYILTQSLSDGDGWAPAPYSSTIRFADVDADGAPEVCGRGGIGVYCSE